MGSVVPRLAEPLGLGSNVCPRRQEVVDTSCSPGLLGLSGRHLGRWVEQTIGQSEKASAL